KLCIEVSFASKVATIYEELCIGRGICVKVRIARKISLFSYQQSVILFVYVNVEIPIDTIEIINLPKDLEKDTTHHYGVNTFKLHSYALAINFQEKAVEAWRGHGPSAQDELKEGQCVLHQLKVKVCGESDDNKVWRRRSNSSSNVSVE
ncbi:ABC transporter E family member 2, partial [Tanacetum coccineum]